MLTLVPFVQQVGLRPGEDVAPKAGGDAISTAATSPSAAAGGAVANTGASPESGRPDSGLPASTGSGRLRLGRTSQAPIVLRGSTCDIAPKRRRE